RSDTVRRGGKPTSRAEFEKFARAHFTALRARGGAGLHVLAERSSSPTLALMALRFRQAFPQAKWTTYEPGYAPGPHAGSVLAFGAPHRTLYDFAKAKVILSLDADFVSPMFPSGLANARGWSKGRVAEGEMNRTYVVEATYSLAGSQADHRLAVSPRQIKAIAAALDAEISPKARPLPELGPAQARPDAAVLKDAAVSKFVAALAKDLLANIGRSIVVVGPEQPAEVHALAHRLNAMLGNVGATVFYTAESEEEQADDVAALKALVAEMPSLDTLLILGGNPAFTAPADVPFADALAKVKTSIHLSLYDDETSARATWHVPAAHYLESWGDARAWDGTISIAQPLIAPLYDGRTASELLEFVLGNDRPDGRALVQRTHATLLDGERALRKALHDGIAAGSALPRVTPALRPLPALKFSEAELGGGAAQNGSYELLIGLDPKVHDGRYANNGWLQELPGTFTKLSWDNAVSVPMAVAERLGLKDGHFVDLEVGGASIRLRALVIPGQAEGCLKVTLGYGRPRAGPVGGLTDEGIDPVGATAYRLWKSDQGFWTTGASLKAAGEGPRLPVSQDNYAIDQLGKDGVNERLGQIVREGTVAEYREKPRFVH